MTLYKPLNILQIIRCLVDDSKKVLTASLDKTIALWSSDGGCDALCDNSYSEAQRLAVPGGPVFSTLLDRRSDDGLADQIYLGTHGKQVKNKLPSAKMNYLLCPF